MLDQVEGFRFRRRSVAACGRQGGRAVAVQQVAGLGRHAVGFEHGEQFFHHRADVAADRHVGLEHAAELGGIAVHLGDLLAGQQLRVPQVAGAFVEAGAKEYQQVGVVDEVAVGIAVGRHAETAQRSGVPSASTPWLEAGGDRDVEAFGKKRRRSRAHPPGCSRNRRRSPAYAQPGSVGERVRRRRVANRGLAGEMNLLEHAGVDLFLLHVVRDR